jgi:hypothetical protein
MRSRCISDLLDMVRVLGRDNVFNSVYDSGSWDNSKCALTELDLLLENYGVERNINLSNTTHLDEMAVLDRAAGWVITLEGKREIRGSRIYFDSATSAWSPY